MIGYDNLSYNLEMLLDLRYVEGTGTNTQDFAKPHHACVLIGTPAWTNLDNDLQFLEFDASNPDYVRSLQAATTDLDFTSGDFSGVAWLNPDALGNRNIFTRGVPVTDGWDFWLDSTGRMSFASFQAAAQQLTYGTAGDVAIGTWLLVGFTRTGATAKIYTNGRDTTGTPATHVDPLTANRNFYVGVNNLAGAAWYDGSMYRPRIWGRLLSAADMLAIFEAERHWFGV